jgi:hypothetical protein
VDDPGTTRTRESDGLTKEDWDRWLAIPVDGAEVLAIVDEFEDHVPPLHRADVPYLAILAVEGRLLRRHVPDSRPHEESLALDRAVVEVVNALPRHLGDYATVASQLGYWVAAIHSLRRSRRCEPRDCLVLEMYDKIVMEGRVDVSRVGSHLRWAIRSATKRAGRRRADSTDLSKAGQRDALGVAWEISAEGGQLWIHAPRGRFGLNTRMIRDRLLPRFRQRAQTGLPPFEELVTRRRQIRVAREEQRRADVDRDIRDLVDRYRADAPSLAAIGRMIGKHGLNVAIPGLRPGGYSSAKEAARAHGVTEYAVKRATKNIEPKIADLLGRTGS